MDEKISLEAIALYGDAYSDKLLKKIFDNKTKLNGKEILTASPIHQINLLIVRELFKAWKEEIKKLKSPYFDYENAEVKEALETFMGILSNNISVDRQHFMPLLKKAVSQTLLVIFDPYDYFSMIISGSANKLVVTNFREEIKYLKINKAPLERLLSKLDEQGIHELSGNEAFAILDQILEEVNFNPEDVDQYIDQFSELEKLNPERFYIQKTSPPQSTPAQQKVSPVAPVTPTIQEKITQPKSTLADDFQKIDRIKDRLTINQKFMFTKVLFGGDFERFSKTVDELDKLNDMPAALNYLEKLYTNWDRESEEFHEFMELVEKRFS